MAIKINTSYALLGLVLLSTACSQEDVRNGVHASGGRIELKASLHEISSRATEMTAGLLDGFQVSAFTLGETSETSYFIDKTFTLNSETNKFFSNDPACVWPNNAPLRFTAFSPSCSSMAGAGGGKASCTGNKLTGFRIAQDIASQFDFITAIATGNLPDHEETGITLNFKHQLSRIKLKAWGNSKIYDLEIAGVRFGGVGTGGVFSFSASEGGVWESVSKGYVEYIFRNGDEIVVIDKTSDTPDSSDNAALIMGAKIGGEDGYENSAMIVPSNNAEWQYKENPTNVDINGNEIGMYISVLLRVIDRTPYSPGSVAYPYSGDSQEGKWVYLAVDREDGRSVKTRVYKNGDDYFTDTELKQSYDLEANDAVVKEFGWAALPVKDEFQPGLVYSYTLNYTNGVGLRDPHDNNPGESVISDKVFVDVKVSPWETVDKTDVVVPRK